MWKRILEHSEGSDFVEYALLVGLVALATVAALTNFQSVINDVWTTISGRLSN